MLFTADEQRVEAMERRAAGNEQVQPTVLNCYCGHVFGLLQSFLVAQSLYVMPPKAWEKPGNVARVGTEKQGRNPGMWLEWEPKSREEAQEYS